MPQTKKIPHCAVKFKAEEDNRMVYESLHCFHHNSEPIHQRQDRAKIATHHNFDVCVRVVV